MKFHDMLIEIASREKDWVVDMNAYLTSHPDLHEIVDICAELGDGLPAHTVLIATLAWTMEALHVHGFPLDAHTFPIVQVEEEEDV